MIAIQERRHSGYAVELQRWLERSHRIVFQDQRISRRQGKQSTESIELLSAKLAVVFGASTLCVPSAIILPPERVSGSTELTNNSPLFRPAGPPCNVGGQPFRQFPFIGATGPNFGLTGNIIAPPFISVLGTPFGGDGNFGNAVELPGHGLGGRQHPAGDRAFDANHSGKFDIQRADGSQSVHDPAYLSSGCAILKPTLR